MIQISSHAGVNSFSGFGICNAGKFALEGMSEALPHEVKPLGINLSIIEPGSFRTNFAGVSLMSAEKEVADYSATGAFRTKLKKST